MGGDGGRNEHDEGRHDDDDDMMRMTLCLLLKQQSTTKKLQLTNGGNPSMGRAMEGQAREVREEGKDGRGGGEHDKSPTMAMAKLLPLLRPPVEVAINQQW